MPGKRSGAGARTEALLRRADVQRRLGYRDSRAALNLLKGAFMKAGATVLLPGRGGRGEYAVPESFFESWLSKRALSDAPRGGQDGQ